MPTANQRDDVRYDLDVDDLDMPDVEIDRLYARAGEKYTNADSIECYVRILAIGRLISGAAKRTDYTQNQSSEKLSQMFSNLRNMRKIFQEDLALAEAGDLVNYGGLRRRPSRIEEHPNDNSASFGMNDAFAIIVD